MKKPVQEYKGKNIVVKYDPNICIHAGNCVKGLPGVFDVNKQPWVNAGGADATAIIQTIKTCPSGALSYEET